MDLVELRILAVSGILAIGITLSALAVAAVTLAERVGHLRHGPAPGPVGTPAVGKASRLGVGQARC
jgi:hypothetical protein